MDAVGLNRAGDVDQVFVEHGHEGDVVFRRQLAEELLEGMDVLPPIIRWQRDSGQHNFDVGIFESSQNGVEVAAALGQWQAAQSVVAAEFEDDHCRMQLQDRSQTGDGVFGGRAAGSLVDYLVVVAARVQVALQSVGEGLAVLQAVAGGDAVAVANEQRSVGGQQLANGQ